MASDVVSFLEGKPQSINPELALDEQAYLLPYNMKYEFPREKLQLGKQLGSGAFGEVLKGIARGILSHEPETTVAVKMIKPMMDSDVSFNDLIISQKSIRNFFFKKNPLNHSNYFLFAFIFR